MIKINPGKIIVSLMVFFMPILLNAVVVLKAPDTFYQGDSVSFKIIAAGSDIEMPVIKSIEGNTVSNAGSSQNTRIVNGERSFQLEQTYSLLSNGDIHIPSFDILVDNTIEKTQAKIIKMLKVEKTKSDLYDLSITVDNKNVYVGEAIEFTLKFKYKKDLDIVGLNYNKPKFESFWVKELTPQKKQDSYTEYVEQEVKYLLFPQKSGKITINPLKISISTVKENSSRAYYFSAPTTTTAVYSNKLELDVKELPQNINLIGKFDIQSTIDKNVINQGEAVSFKLFINGRGNIDDLEELKLDIPNTTIYDNPSKKEYDIRNKLYGGQYSKTYSIVGKNSFTIPSIEIKYFDKSSETIKTIKTKEHNITVNEKVVHESKLEVAAPVVKEVISKKEESVVVKITNDEKLIYFMGGLIFGLVLMALYLLWGKRPNKNENTPLLSQVKKAKTSDELFKLLVVYINIDEELDKLIYKLENLPVKKFKDEKSKTIKVLKVLIKKDIPLKN